MFDLIWWIVVGLIAGWITGKIMKGGGYGALMDIILGIVGAVIGGYLAVGRRYGQRRDDLHPSSSPSLAR